MSLRAMASLLGPTNLRALMSLTTPINRAGWIRPRVPTNVRVLMSREAPMSPRTSTSLTGPSPTRLMNPTAR